ncbi:MAG: flagellar basal body L-ring protein FlgH [Pseudomonadota bacterium]|jgi:flagellar L-ring protein precursor FlgH
MRNWTRFLMAAASLMMLAGCDGIKPSTSIQQPMTARPIPQRVAHYDNGSIYQAGYNERPLFEDRRARNVGDILTISIVEKTAASKKSSSSATHAGSTDVKLPTAIVPLLNSKPLLKGINVTGSDSDTFSGKGDSASNNDFTSTITVTVIEVLPNGNLVVSGEKQISINQGDEFVRFSGVVNPNSINNNTVVSTQVADAHIEYKGAGYINEAQTMGWLGRFFLSVLPF